MRQSELFARFTGPAPPSRRLLQGMSLLETMVGLTIGLLLVTVVVRGFAAGSSNARTNSLVSEYQTNGRYALETLRRSVRHAALSPLVWDATQLNISSAAATKTFGCGAGVTTSLRSGILASNDANPYTASCLMASTASPPYLQYARGDVLSLRGLGLDAVTSFVVDVPYARVSYGSGDVFLGQTDTPAALAPPALDYPLVHEVYFINRFTVSPSETPRVPALYRLRLSDGASPTLVPELVASNIEHMQWQFAMKDGSGKVRYFDPQDVTDWANVISARVWLLLKSSEVDPGLVNSSYTLGSVTYSPTDNFRRAVLSSTINLRNQ